MQLVNLVLNNNNNYKLIILDGKNTNLLEFREPQLTLVQILIIYY